MVGETISHYKIIAKLGQGGMGEVFLAQDTSLDRKVALKFLPDSLRQNPVAEKRFLREAKSAAALDHPYVCNIYQVGEEDGKSFISMEYVQGKTLRNELAKGPLDLNDVLEKAGEIAEAIEAAHKQNIVHRDLKPSNIMLTPDGHVKVMDFGLAKQLIEREDEVSQQQTISADLTKAGAALGTLPYMSPEQLRGQEVDTRSDIFSFGLVLYEMLTGIHPLKKEHSLDTASNILNVNPPPLSRYLNEVPSLLQHVVTKMLNKDPKRRYQNIGEVRIDLKEALGRRETVSETTHVTSSPAPGAGPLKRWIAAGVLGLLILGLGGYLLWRGVAPSVDTAASAAQGDRKMIVVLPFENLGTPEEEYFADGMTEEITSRLATLDGLGVISRTSAVLYEESGLSVKQIGEELGVDYILEGTVRWQRSTDGPSQVRVTPQLIQVSEDTHLWAERYTAVLADIFEVQSDIAQQVIEQLGIALLDPQRRSLESQPTENLEAYDFYLRGNDYLNRGKELESSDQIHYAIQMYEEALRLDPAFALAEARQSVAHSWLYSFYVDRTEERLGLAQEAVDRALGLEPELPEAHYALGLIYSYNPRDKDQALDEFQIVLRYQPSNADVFAAIGWLQTELGQWEDARTSMKKAMELNPRLGRLACWTGGFCFALRDFSDAIHYHDRAIDLTPDRACPYYCEISIYLNRDGNTTRAREFLEQLPQTLGLEGNPPLNYHWVNVDIFERRYQDALRRLSSGSSPVYEFLQNFYTPKDQLFAQIHGLLDRPELEQKHYQAARNLLEAKVNERPEDARIHSSLGIAYAGLGRKEEAVREGKLGIELLDGSKGIILGFRLKDLAQIHLMVGNDDEAMDHLEHLLSVPGQFSVGYLEVDPIWNPLRDHPRFLALLERYSSTTASR